MPIPGGFSCISGSNLPENKNVRGYNWLLCPYSDVNNWPESVTGISSGEKTTHNTTEGRMIMGNSKAWKCEDDSCYYYTTVSPGSRYLYAGPGSLPGQ